MADDRADRDPRTQRERLGRVTLLVMDVDGVLTDTLMHTDPDGAVSKGYSTRDGMAFFLMHAAGITPVFITGDDTASILERAKRGRVDEVHLGVRDKRACMRSVLDRLGRTWEEAAYMGDDLNDLGPMRRAGIAFAPPTAVASVVEEADIITSAPAGAGAVREALELILDAKGIDTAELFERVLRELAERKDD